MLNTDLQIRFAKGALLAQSACNLVAILGSWREHLIATKGEYKNSDDQHKDAPSVLFATQVSHLCGGPLWDTEGYGEAYRACENRAQLQNRLTRES